MTRKTKRNEVSWHIANIFHALLIRLKHDSAVFSLIDVSPLITILCSSYRIQVMSFMVLKFPLWDSTRNSFVSFLISGIVRIKVCLKVFRPPGVFCFLKSLTSFWKCFSSFYSNGVLTCLQFFSLRLITVCQMEYYIQIVSWIDFNVIC